MAKEAAMRPLRRLMTQLDCLDDEPHATPQQAQAAQADIARNVASKVREQKLFVILPVCSRLAQNVASKVREL